MLREIQSGCLSKAYSVPTCKPCRSTASLSRITLSGEPESEAEKVQNLPERKEKNSSNVIGHKYSRSDSAVPRYLPDHLMVSPSSKIFTYYPDVFKHLLDCIESQTTQHLYLNLLCTYKSQKRSLPHKHSHLLHLYASQRQVFTFTAL